jgi:hypothetical protein
MFVFNSMVLRMCYQQKVRIEVIAIDVKRAGMLLCLPAGDTEESVY